MFQKNDFLSGLLSCLFSGCLAIFLTACQIKSEPQNLEIPNAKSVIYEGVSLAPADFNTLPAVGMLFSKYRVQQKADFFFIDTLTVAKRLYVCEDEPLAQELNFGSCTGTLISEDLVLTAGHCFDHRTFCKDTLFTFHWVQGEQGQMEQLHRDQVYSCVEVLQQEEDLRTGKDYAIFRLDRKVKDIEPMKIAAAPIDLVDSASYLSNEVLFSVSYPLGTTKKIDQATWIKSNQTRAQFYVKVDTFSGSSGSPLVNSRGEIVGILSRGADDITEDEIEEKRHSGQCLRFNRCEKSSCYGETYYNLNGLEF